MRFAEHYSLKTRHVPTSQPQRFNITTNKPAAKLHQLAHQQPHHQHSHGSSERKIKHANADFDTTPEYVHKEASQDLSCTNVSIGAVGNHQKKASRKRRNNPSSDLRAQAKRHLSSKARRQPPSNSKPTSRRTSNTPTELRRKQRQTQSSDVSGPRNRCRHERKMANQHDVRGTLPNEEFYDASISLNDAAYNHQKATNQKIRNNLSSDLRAPAERTSSSKAQRQPASGTNKHTRHAPTGARRERQGDQPCERYHVFRYSVEEGALLVLERRRQLLEKESRLLTIKNQQHQKTILQLQQQVITRS